MTFRYLIFYSLDICHILISCLRNEIVNVLHFMIFHDQIFNPLSNRQIVVHLHHHVEVVNLLLCLRPFPHHRHDGLLHQDLLDVLLSLSWCLGHFCALLEELQFPVETLQGVVQTVHVVSLLLHLLHVVQTVHVVSLLLYLLHVVSLLLYLRPQLGPNTRAVVGKCNKGIFVVVISLNM